MNNVRHIIFLFVESAQIRKNGVEPIIDRLNLYGGWPILDADWTKPDQTIEELMGKMRSELNEHFLISILVGPDDKNSSVNVLLVMKKKNAGSERICCVTQSEICHFSNPHRSIN